MRVVGTGRPAWLTRVSLGVEWARRPMRPGGNAGQRRMYRDGYALIVSAVGTSLIGVLYWALAARLYPTRFVGLNSTAISSMLLLSGIAQLNLMSALIRFVPRAGPNTRMLIAGVYCAIITAGIIVGLGLALLRGVWTPAPVLFGTGNASPFFWWFVLSTIAWGIFALQDYVLTGLRQAVWVPIENIVFAVAKIALLVAFVRFQTYGIFLSWTIPTLVGIIVVNLLIFGHFIPRQRRAAPTEPEDVSMGQLVRYITWDYFGALAALASTALLPLLVTEQVGATAAAHFYLAWIFAYGVHLVTLNLSASFTVEGTTDEAGLQTLGRHVLWHTVRLVTPLVVVMSLAAPVLLHVFPSGYASSGVPTLRLLALGAIPNTLTVVYIAMARVRRQTGRVFVVQLGLCLLVLGLSRVLLTTMGVAGVGLAWLIAQTTVAVALALTALRPLLRRGSRVPGEALIGPTRVRP